MTTEDFECEISTGEDSENDETRADSPQSEIGRRSFIGFTGTYSSLEIVNRLWHGDSGRDEEPGRETGSPIANALETDEVATVPEENERPGEEGWEPRQLGSDIAISEEHPVLAYTTSVSIEPGEPLELCVETSSAYDIEIYRLGWYDGDGGRLVAEFSTARPPQQPGFTVVEPAKMVQCDWEVTDTVEATADWTTGLYYAWIKTDDGHYAHPFVVKNANPVADMAIQLPIATQQAYNGWGNWSLYGHVTDPRGNIGTAVSHDRPYRNPFSRHLNYATHLIRWIEREGYSVEYLCDQDVHHEPDRLQEYLAVISAGHDEYWSIPQYDGFMAARENGVNLAFMGANIAFWRIFYENDGRYYRCEKTEQTDLFRNIGRHEATLKGMASYGYMEGSFPGVDVDEQSLDHPWMANTGFEDDRTPVAGVVGHEWSWIQESNAPSEYTRFFRFAGEKGREEGLGGVQPCDVIGFESESGSIVFHCGTLAWTWRLDPDAGWDPQHPGQPMGRGQPGDELLEPETRIQQFQSNVFTDLTRS